MMLGRWWRRRLVGFASLALLVGATGCGTTGSGPVASSTASVTLTVSAASSLTVPMRAIERHFEQTHPNVDVVVNLASSGVITQQVVAGAPADLVVLADTAPMDQLTSAGLVGAPSIVARNRMAIITTPGNPLGVTGLADLARLPVVALCVSSAPCGKYADTLLARAGVTLPTVTRGPDATATVAAVTVGGAGAAVVYASDAHSAGSAVSTVDIPDADNLIARYPAAVVQASAHQAVSNEFLTSLIGSFAQSTLAAAGFLGP